MNIAVKKTSNARTIGQYFEEQAATFLSDRGIQILKKNYTLKMGELDLIGFDGNQILFVEVRYRKTSLYGSAAESITASKINKIKRTASFYLQKHPHWAKYPCRFDVIAINAPASNDRMATPTIEWIQNAL